MISLTGRMPTLPCTPLPPRDPFSSLGVLGCLPPELMLNMIAQMDFLSIVRFSQVSVQANAYVRSCHEFRSFLGSVPEAVKALCRLGILSLHSVANLYGALRAEECAICGESGPFLFLPTCQRCCDWCRKHHPSLQLIYRGQAVKYFGLSQQEAASLPIVHVRRAMVHGGAGPDHGGGWTIHGRAVVAQMARNLALSVHGSEAEVERAVMAQCITPSARAAGQYWTTAHRVRPRFDWLSVGTHRQDAHVPSHVPLGMAFDEYGTMATMVAPTLTKDGTLEHARWCQGCVSTRDSFRAWRHKKLVNAALMDSMKAYIPAEYRTDEYDPWEVMFGLPNRAWSRESFAQHVRGCPGAQRLLQNGS